MNTTQRAQARVQFITHYTSTIDYVQSARLALQGGCRWIQLRMKQADEPTFIAAAQQVRQLCNEYGATFVIDDHVELVQRVQADGVHLGKNDMPIRQARALLGQEYIIGGTANTFEDVCRHAADGADYIGCGPYQYTTTKQRLAPLLGLQGYASMMQQMQQASIDLPLVAIGGIEQADIPPLLQVGVNGIALSGSVLRATDPVESMRQVLACVNGHAGLCASKDRNV